MAKVNYQESLLIASWFANEDKSPSHEMQKRYATRLHDLSIFVQPIH